MIKFVIVIGPCFNSKGHRKEAQRNIYNSVSMSLSHLCNMVGMVGIHAKQIQYGKFFFERPLYYRELEAE